MALLLLVDISAFPAFQIHYVQPAFPLLSLAAVLSIALLVEVAGVRRLARPPGHAEGR